MRRFKASIYLDVWIDSQVDLETARHEAEKQVKQLIRSTARRPRYMAQNCCNLYLGGVALFTPGNLKRPLDKEI